MQNILKLKYYLIKVMIIIEIRRKLDYKQGLNRTTKLMQFIIFSAVIILFIQETEDQKMMMMTTMMMI
jgi:hypothetical protein